MPIAFTDTFDTKKEIRELIDQMLYTEKGTELLVNTFTVWVSGDDPASDITEVLETVPVGYQVFIVKDENHDRWFIPAENAESALQMIKSLAAQIP